MHKFPLLKMALNCGTLINCRDKGLWFHLPYEKLYNKHLVNYISCLPIPKPIFKSNIS